MLNTFGRLLGVRRGAAGIVLLLTVMLVSATAQTFTPSALNIELKEGEKTAVTVTMNRADALPLTIVENADWLQTRTTQITSVPAQIVIDISAVGRSVGYVAESIAFKDTNNVTRHEFVVGLTVTNAGPPTIEAIPNGVAAAFSQGTTSISETIVQLRNNGPETTYTATIVGGGPWITLRNPAGTLSGYSADTYLNVVLKPQFMAIGQNTAQIIVAAPGRPQLTIPVSVSVHSDTLTVITASPLQILVHFDSPGDSPKQTQVTLTNSGPAASFVGEVEGNSWVKLSGASGTIPQNSSYTFTVTVSPETLTTGTHAAQIAIYPAARETVLIPVTATVGTSYAPELSSKTLTLNAIAGQVAKAAGEVTLTTQGNAASFTASASQAWLSVSPVAGQVSATSPVKLTIQADASKMSAGTFVGTMTVIAGGKSLVVNVTLKVITSAPISVSPSTGEFQVTPGTTPAPQTFAVTTDAGEPATFGVKATSATDWLVAALGLSGSGTFVISVDAGKLPALPATGLVSILHPTSGVEWKQFAVRAVTAPPLMYSLAQVADGGGFTTAITLINPSPEVMTASMRFRKGVQSPALSTGPWRPEVVGNALLEAIVIGPNSSVTVETTGEGAEIASGWADIAATGPLKGFAIFRQRTYTGQTQEATVPFGISPTQRVSLPVDNTAGMTTSVALANLSASESSKVEYTLRNKDGKVAGMGTLVTLPPQGHTATELKSLLPAVADMTGSLDLAANGGILSALALRFHPAGAFTSFEVQTGGRATARGVIPQVADGGGFTTELTLVNLGTVPAPVTVAFRRELQDGAHASEVWPVGLQGLPATGGTVNLTIPVGSSHTIRTTGIGTDVRAGFASIESTQPLGGFAVFRLVRNDFPVQEATVSLDAWHPSGFSVPYDNANGFITGLALTNPNTSEPARVEVTVRDKNGAVAGTDTIELPPLGHTSFEFPARLPSSAGSAGTADFKVVTGSVSAIGLRFSPVGPFTSFPPQWW